MKKHTNRFLAMALTLCSMAGMLSGCGGKDTTGAGGDSAVVPTGESVVWRLQSNYALDSMQGAMAKDLAASLDKATNGRLTLELYEPGALCQASDIVTYLSQDSFDLAIIFGATYSGVLPEADIDTGIPFAWETSSEIYDAMENYGLHDLIQEAYDELGIEHYWIAHEPNYNTLCNFTVDSIDDYAGKKIRALGAWGDYYAALGASPVNVAGTEVYQALQLGTIDGALYGWSSLSDSNNIREVVDYGITPTMCHIAMGVVVSQTALESLPADLHDVVDETIRLCAMGQIAQNHVASTEKSVNDALNADTVELIELDDDTINDMREIAVKEVWDKLAQKSDRMAQCIEILKQQSRDYGRQVDF